jgi:hypothetical protein
VVQHVLRTVSRPDRQKAVIVLLEAAAATLGDEPPRLELQRATTCGARG